MAISLVVFDVAGTTVHDGGGAVQRAMRDAISAAGLELRDGAMDGVTGMAKPQAIRTLLEGHGREELVARTDAIHADFVGRMRRYYQQDPAVVPIEGTVQAFAFLRSNGIKVALNTGFSRVILDDILARLHWIGPQSPIDATIASDEVRRGRPHADMIDALRMELGDIPAANVAKVGDTPIDLYEGTMARCGLVVGVLSGAHGLDSMMQHPNDALINSVAELPELLRERELVQSHEA
jgi:phosphonatase-like hydrolase